MTGRYYEEFEVGETIEHEKRRTISERDNQQFCDMTMNQQPLHLDAEFASETQFGERLVNGLYTMSLAVGITIPDDRRDDRRESLLRQRRAPEPRPRGHYPRPVDGDRQARDQRRRARHRHHARRGVQNEPSRRAAGLRVRSDGTLAETRARNLAIPVDQDRNGTSWRLLDDADDLSPPLFDGSLENDLEVDRGRDADRVHANTDFAAGLDVVEHLSDGLACVHCLSAGATRAWMLAGEIAASHGLEIVDALSQRDTV